MLGAGWRLSTPQAAFWNRIPCRNLWAPIVLKVWLRFALDPLSRLGNKSNLSFFFAYTANLLAPAFHILGCDMLWLWLWLWHALVFGNGRHLSECLLSRFPRQIVLTGRLSVAPPMPPIPIWSRLPCPGQKSKRVWDWCVWLLNT